MYRVRLQTMIETLRIDHARVSDIKERDDLMKDNKIGLIAIRHVIRSFLPFGVKCLPTIDTVLEEASNEEELQDLVRRVYKIHGKCHLLIKTDRAKDPRT